jgi:hypothetical protein
VRTTIIIALALVSAAGGALAEPLQARTFYNEKGQEVGRATTRGTTTTFSNEKG